MTYNPFRPSILTRLNKRCVHYHDGNIDTFFFYWNQNQRQKIQRYGNKLLRRTKLGSCEWCAKLFIKGKKHNDITTDYRCYKCECELAEMRREEAESDYQDDMRAQFCIDNPDHEDCECDD